MWTANPTYNYSDAYGYSGTLTFAGWDTVISAYHRQNAYYFCANENSFCSLSETRGVATPVRYGSTSNDTWAPAKMVNGGIWCTNANFGDPTPNIAKVCQVLYKEGSYTSPPGDPIYHATYKGFVYKPGTTVTTYTGTYTGTVYGN